MVIQLSGAIVEDKIGFLNDFIFTPSANVNGVMRFFSLKIKQLYYHYTHISGEYVFPVHLNTDCSLLPLV